MRIVTTCAREWSGVRAEEYPTLHRLLDVICHDGGGSSGWRTYLLEPLSDETLRLFETELKSLSDEDFEDFAIGEETEMQRVAGRSEIMTAVQGVAQAFFDNGTPRLTQPGERQEHEGLTRLEEKS